MTQLITPGAIAPDFELSDMKDKTVHLSDFRGKPLVIVFLRGLM